MPVDSLIFIFRDVKPLQIMYEHELARAMDVYVFIIVSHGRADLL